MYISLIVDASHEHIEVLVGANGDFLFFRHREGPWVPTLRLLHKCKIMPVYQFYVLHI